MLRLSNSSQWSFNNMNPCCATITFIIKLAMDHTTPRFSTSPIGHKTFSANSVFLETHSHPGNLFYWAILLTINFCARTSKHFFFDTSALWYLHGAYIFIIFFFPLPHFVRPFASVNPRVREMVSFREMMRFLDVSISRRDNLLS